MDKLDIRMTAGQLADVIDALGAAAEHAHDDTAANRYIRLGSWLSDRYTRRWGLTPRAGAALEALRRPQ